MPPELPAGLDRMLRWVRVDFAPTHRQPSVLSLATALVVAVAGSLAADALLVAAGTALFPATKGYVHFQVHDYARLTVIGVVIACAAWPVVTRVSSAPRWLFLRLAMLPFRCILRPPKSSRSSGEGRVMRIFGLYRAT